MDETRRTNAVIVLSSEDDDDDDDDDDGEEEEEEEEEEEDDSEDDHSDCDEVSESDDGALDDSSLSDKVVSLLQGGNDIDSLKLNECKAYLRKHGLRMAGNRDVCVKRIREHWRLKNGSGYTLYPRSSFTINCTGDVCMGDVVLFRQRVYEKFDKVTRHGKILGNRTVAGRVVKESYGSAKQQHTFTVEVLWSSGVRKLPPLFPLLVKGRNLYKQKTYRQRWKKEADRVEVLHEKHKRGAAARSVRALKQKKKSSYADQCSKGKHEIHNTTRSKLGRSNVVDKVRRLDGSKRANYFQPQEATSSTHAGWKENGSSRTSRSTRSQKNAEFDHYQVPIYPLYDGYPQSSYQYRVNSQSRNEPNEFFCHERGLLPNMTGIPPSRPHVNQFTSRSRHLSSRNSHHAPTNLYDFEMKNLNVDHVDRPLQLSPRAKNGWRRYGL